MKKILIILFLFFLITNRNKENIIYTFKELSYNPVLCIYFSKENINTKNILELLPEESLIEVKPYINKNINMQFSTLDMVLDNYKNISNKYGYNDWYIKNYLGIKIEKIKVKMSTKKLEALFSKHKTFKICND